MHPIMAMALGAPGNRLRPRERYRKIAQSVEQTEHSKFQRGPSHAHMPEFGRQVWRMAQVA
jgi:hypothetical protein